ncbi:MAG: AbrB/MazE/SpoVT family DNA-binding domain-containing protein [Desulfurococcales archaeon]|nr:AbrB/MazE/SpoVT family DNA-binding domain-containing protein [Desulfurococcales archaeon]
MEIEIRRIQRVGTSSLVVTLPKEWARKLGLEPGAQVMLIDEDDGIKIKPVDRKGTRAVRLDLSRIPDNLAASTPLCIYLSSISEAEVVFPSREAINEAKYLVLNLMGLQIYDSVDSNNVRIEVLLDPSKIDIPKLLRTLSVNVRETSELLRKALTGDRGDVAEKLNIARTNFLRTHYIILRYLAATYSEKGGVKTYQTALSTSYAGFALDLLQELIQIAPKLVKEGLSGEDMDKLMKIIEGIENSGDLLFRVLANPSVKRLVDLQSIVAETRKLAEDLMVNADSREAAVLAGKLHDIVRLLIIAYYVAICRVITEVSTRKSQG